MHEDGERHRDFELRAIIHEYEQRAEQTREQAKRTTDAAECQKLISLANSFTGLAEALRGPRPRPPKYSIPRYRIQFLNHAYDSKGYEIWDGARRVHVEIY